MRRKKNFLFLLVFAPSFLWAAGFATEDRHQKHAIHAGFSVTLGDVFEETYGHPIRLGYSYLAENRFVFGLFYEPFLIFDSLSGNEGKASLRSSVLGPYSGFQLNESFFLIAGLTYSMTQCYFKAEDDHSVTFYGEGIGFNLGANYVANKLVIGARFSTYRFRDGYGGSGTGSSFGLDAGVLL